MPTLLNDAQQADPILGGSSFIFEAQRSAAVPASAGSTVFVAAEADWGPVGVPVRIPAYSDLPSNAKLDDGTTVGFGVGDHALRRAVFGAFLGENLPGRGGAGEVRAWRLAGATAAAASLVLQNTTPAPGATFRAKYPGTRGNGFQLTVRVGADAGTDEFVIVEDGREVETYQYPTGDLASLAADIAASSSRGTLDVTIANVPLAHVTGAALAGGDDGLAYTVGDYTAMLDALEFEPFGVFAAYDVTDPAIVAALLAWKDDVKTRGKGVMLALGGPAGETFAAHKARAGGYDDPDVVAFGTGDIDDSTLSTDGSSVRISTAQGVARVAGAIARRGEAQGMQNVRFAGWAAVNGANRAQAQIAVQSGMAVLIRDGDREAPTFIADAPTSYVDDTDSMPKEIYGEVKFVRTMQGLEADIIALQEGAEGAINGQGVTTKSRDLIRGGAKSIVKARVDRGVLQPGSDADYDPERPPRASDSTVALVYDAVFVRGLKGIRNRIRVG